MDKTMTKFTDALLSLDRIAAQELMDRAVSAGSPMDFIEETVVRALENIGEGWQNGTYALSQVYMAGRICEELIDQILPPDDPDRTDQPKMAICVLADHHRLGKVIVYSLLRSSGFDLLDLDVIGVDDLVARVAEERIEILLISVLMLPSALQIKSVREKLNDRGLDVKIVVGGAAGLSSRTITARSPFRYRKRY